MVNFVLERSTADEDKWGHYCNLGCDETEAIKMWHHLQDRQPYHKFRMYKVTKELVAMSGNAEYAAITAEGVEHDS